MTMPFVTGEPGAVYNSEVWAGLRLHFEERHLLLEAPEGLDGLGELGVWRRARGFTADGQHLC